MCGEARGMRVPGGARRGAWRGVCRAVIRGDVRGSQTTVASRHRWTGAVFRERPRSSDKRRIGCDVPAGAVCSAGWGESTLTASPLAQIPLKCPLPLTRLFSLRRVALAAAAAPRPPCEDLQSLAAREAARCPPSSSCLFFDLAVKSASIFSNVSGDASGGLWCGALESHVAFHKEAGRMGWGRGARAPY